MFVVVNYFGPGGSGFRVVQMNNQSVTMFPNEVLPGRVPHREHDSRRCRRWICISAGIAGTPAFAGVAFGTVAAPQNFPRRDRSTCTLTVAGDPSTVAVYRFSVIVTSGETRTLVDERRAAGVVVARATIDTTRPISSEGQLKSSTRRRPRAQLDLLLIAAGETTHRRDRVRRQSAGAGVCGRGAGAGDVRHRIHRDGVQNGDRRADVRSRSRTAAFTRSLRSMRPAAARRIRS